MRIFRGTRHLNSKGWIPTSTWIGIVVTLWIIAWIIAESIPVFNDLLGLISALFASCTSCAFFSRPELFFYFVSFFGVTEGNVLTLHKGSHTAWAAFSGCS